VVEYVEWLIKKQYTIQLNQHLIFEYWDLFEISILRFEICLYWDLEFTSTVAGGARIISLINLNSKGDKNE
jgi:hypothetical protein